MAVTHTTQVVMAPKCCDAPSMMVMLKATDPDKQINMTGGNPTTEIVMGTKMLHMVTIATMLDLENTNIISDRVSVADTKMDTIVGQTTVDIPEDDAVFWEAFLEESLA